ncbi:hypothetical protein Tco_0701622 [Tanacetum coccineum]
MADKEAKLTTRKIVTNDQVDYYSGITSITVNEKNAYELKGKFLDDMHKNAFSVQLPTQDRPDVLTKDVEGFKTYDKYKDEWIYEWNENVPWVYEKPWTDTGVWTEPAPIVHCCKPFNYKNGYSEWPTCSWKEDGYCNEENLPGAYIVGNTLRYQDLEWFDALKDIKLKEEALRNKATIEGMIDENDESSNNGWRKWDGYEISDHDQEEREYENEHEDEEKCESFDDHELPVCTIRRFEMIKYSFGQDEEYVAIKEDEYEGLMNTSKEAIY